ncbi:unnamed protein product [Rhizoctonia solani]|uniref:Uncharacterized protein n=1 Tax=Rhizoctonia solani TaxID=456999 RepID=A0A8H3DK96_9AGAM|nr:unnamed protein product [Rhizoctonia solani]
MEDLPSYTPEVLPGYDLTPATTRSPPSTRPSSPVPFLARARDHENYRYRSERMELDLGPRRWGTRLPAYGKLGQVEGVIKVHSFGHVERIVVRLIGKLHASHVVNHIPTLSQSQPIINKEIEVWSAKAPSASTSAEESRFPFSFTLDKEEMDSTTGSLPPSVAIQLHRASARIAYAIRVDMYRRGLHMHEMIQTEILHLPRTVTHYSRPFIPESGNEKRPRITESEWNRSRLQRDFGKGSKVQPDLTFQKDPELLLPRDLRFPSGEDIPFLSRPFIPESGNEKRPRITESEWNRSRLERDLAKGSKVQPNLTFQKDPELLLPRDLRFPSGEDIPFLISIPETHASAPEMEIQLVRLSTVQTRAGVIQQAKSISHGRIHDHPTPESNPRTTVQGTISTGEAEKDVSWGFGTLLSVSYEIRVALSFSVPEARWKLTQPIELTSHEWRGELSSMMPSLGSSATSRTGVNLININI